MNGTFDLNIVIRTAIVDKENVQIGAGGAIVLQSDPEEEYDEMKLKASALMRAIDKCAGHKEKRSFQDVTCKSAEHQRSILVAQETAP